MVDDALTQQGLKSANRRAKAKEDLYEQMEEALDEQVWLITPIPEESMTCRNMYFWDEYHNRFPYIEYHGTWWCHFLPVHNILTPIGCIQWG